jgi:thymidylate kinase
MADAPLFNSNQVVIALDGHDGAGKTSLAKLAAKKYGFKYVKPFDDSLGDLISWSFKNRKFDFTDEISRLAIEKIYEEGRGENLIFDRHWLSIFTVIPVEYHIKWFPVPRTILCWSNLKTTMHRISERGEKEGDAESHAFYCGEYRRLAGKYEVPIIDTSFEEISKSFEHLCLHIDALLATGAST